MQYFTQAGKNVDDYVKFYAIIQNIMRSSKILGDH